MACWKLYMQIRKPYCFLDILAPINIWIHHHAIDTIAKFFTLIESVLIMSSLIMFNELLVIWARIERKSSKELKIKKIKLSLSLSLLLLLLLLFFCFSFSRSVFTVHIKFDPETLENLIAVKSSLNFIVYIRYYIHVKLYIYIYIYIYIYVLLSKRVTSLLLIYI